MPAKNKRTHNTGPATTAPAVHTTVGIDVLDRSNNAYHQALAITDLVANCKPHEITVEEPYETLWWLMRNVEECLKTMRECSELMWHDVPREKLG